MANLTVHEFNAAPDEALGFVWPADLVTRIATPSTLTLHGDTKVLIVTSDADCRVAFDNPTSVSASDMVVLGGIENIFAMKAGANRKVKFGP